MADRVHQLADLQNLELQIREAKDPALKKQEEALGFSVDGLAHLEEAYERLIKKIPKADLRLYRRIRRRYDRAVVPVSNRICLGCFQELPTSRKREIEDHAPLPTCESCGRILYWL